MSQKSFVQKVANISGTGKKLYRDSIMDAGFVGLFDFNSDYCRNGSTAAGAGKALKNLVDGGADATVLTAFPSGFSSKGLISANGGGQVALPAAFKLASGEQHFAFCIWAGYNTAFGALPANGTVSLGGYAYQNNSFNQYGITFSTNADGTALTNLRGYGDGTGADFPSSTFAKMLDGTLHQWITEFEVITGGTQKRITVYCDSAQVGQLTVAYDGALNDPTGSGQGASVGPYLGQIAGFVNNGFKGFYGRTWLKRFALDPENIPIATVAAKEWEKYGATPRFA